MRCHVSVLLRSDYSKWAAEEARLKSEPTHRTSAGRHNQSEALWNASYEREAAVHGYNEHVDACEGCKGLGVRKIDLDAV